MKTPEQGWQHVGIFGMEIIARSVEIRRHRRVEQHAVLLTVELAHFQPGNFGQRVGFVGRFERARQQAIFLQRLGRHRRVDASTAQEQEPFDIMLVSGVDGMRGHSQVIVNKFCGFMSGSHGCNPYTVNLILAELRKQSGELIRDTNRTARAVPLKFWHGLEE